VRSTQRRAAEGSLTQPTPNVRSIWPGPEPRGTHSNSTAECAEVNTRNAEDKGSVENAEEGDKGEPRPTKGERQVHLVGSAATESPQGLTAEVAERTKRGDPVSRPPRTNAGTSPANRPTEGYFAARERTPASRHQRPRSSPSSTESLPDGLAVPRFVLVPSAVSAPSAFGFGVPDGTGGAARPTIPDVGVSTNHEQNGSGRAHPQLEKGNPKKPVTPALDLPLRSLRPLR